MTMTARMTLKKNEILDSDDQVDIISDEDLDEDFDE